MTRFPRYRNVIVNIRGTNGSGKSYIVSRLLEAFGGKPLKDEKGKVWAYCLSGCASPTFVLGRYTAGTQTGGCDTIKSTGTVYVQLEKLAARGNVLLEGLVLSGTYGPLVAMASCHPEYRFIFIALSTSLQKCILRVMRRRAKSGKALPPLKMIHCEIPKWGVTPGSYPMHVVRKYCSVLSSAAALRAKGFDVRRWSSKTTLEKLSNWLRRGQ